MSVDPETRPDIDIPFFAQHKGRRLRIRLPESGEFEQEFQTLGPHTKARRRVIVARVSRAAAMMMRQPQLHFMKMPFLLFSDETVEDRDDILAPILEEIMRAAAREQGVVGRG